MSRRKPKRTPIVVDDRTRELPWSRLTTAMEALQVYSYERYLRVISLAETYAAAYAGTESDAEFQARIDGIRGVRSKVAN
ncbi:MAG: hypothetical protein SFX73_39245 [Kofleriaceae bacterium]|nr:hypothetical protein [Kofleriaceae bacterium]